MMLFSGKILRRARRRKSTRETAFTTHTQRGLVWKLRKHKKDAPMRIVMEMMALSM